MLTVLFIAFTPTTAHAHNPDTSYIRVRVTPDWLDVRFTYDLEVLDRAFQIDQNTDGTISRDEFQAAAPRVIKFLRQSVDFEVDDYAADFGDAEAPVWPENSPSIGPGERQSALVHFPFRKRIQELPESIAVTFRVFNMLGNTHTILGTFHHPPHVEDEVVFTKFEPDYLFFTYDEPGSPGAAVASDDWRQRWNQSMQFFRLGVKHIFLGYDHILFLLALAIVDRLRTLVKIITAFTVAHSITLILAATQVVSVPSRFIESAIAATIVYVAFENLWVKDTRHRWWLTFAFGLVHGFGFANVLRELGLPTQGLVQCLLSFNVGVEVGQLAIVAPVWPLWRLLARQSWGVWLTRAVSVAIGCFGLAWFIDRAFGIGFMPF